MTDIVKPTIYVRDGEDPFLIPPDQPGSYVDALAFAQCSIATISVRSSDDIIMLIIFEAP